MGVTLRERLPKEYEQECKLLLIRYSGHEDTVRENIVHKITNSNNNSERKRPKEGWMGKTNLTYELQNGPQRIHSL